MTNVPRASHMHWRIRIDHAEPYVSIETTSDAEPTMIVPSTHSAATSDTRIVEVGISRRSTTTRAWRATDLAAVIAMLLCCLPSPRVSTHYGRRPERLGGGSSASHLRHRQVDA